MAIRLFRVWVLIGGVVMLSGCAVGGVTPTMEAAQVDTTTPQPTRTPRKLPDTWTPTATFTATAAPPPSATPTPSSTLPPINTLAPTDTPDPRNPVLAPVEELDQMMLQFADNAILQNLILFTSQAVHPFPGLYVGEPDKVSLSGKPFAGTQLWAFSPDGQRAGRLTSIDQALVAYWPGRAEEKLVLVQEDGVTYNHEAILGLDLPGECYGRMPESELDTWQIPPCDGFQFSPGGRTLAFFYGPEICGRGIILINSLSGEMIYRSGPGGGFSFEYLRDGKALLMEGHCEGGWISLFDPLTGGKNTLGDYGQVNWNVNHSVLAVSYGVYGHMGSGLWVFDALVDQLVKIPPAPEDLEMEDHPVWSPTGRYLVFQRREITNGNEEVTFDGPRQILRLDVQSGEITLLAGEEGYDYHLCQGNTTACPWYGAWQQVRRVPFEPETLPYYGSSKLDCYLNGETCDKPPELFALNANTGEMIPWEQAGFAQGQPKATPTATPAPVGPDYQAGAVYRHPFGFYAFYPGLDGHSLWMVPLEGEPVLWVREGENFVYVP